MSQNRSYSFTKGTIKLEGRPIISFHPKPTLKPPYIQQEPAKKHRPLSSWREQKLVLKKLDGFAKKVSNICIYI